MISNQKFSEIFMFLIKKQRNLPKSPFRQIPLIVFHLLFGVL